MNRPGGKALGAVLSALAGFVDALGYLALGRLFVAFMSGNSTILGVGLIEDASGHKWVAAGLVAMFVAGVMAGTWAGQPFGDRRAPAVLLLVAALLACAAGLATAGLVVPACLVVAMAMGTENAAFSTETSTGVGLTYMTGTLVRVGHKAVTAFGGGRWLDVLPDLLLWTGMVAGAALGAVTYQQMQLDGLWIAATVAALMAGVAWLIQRPRIVKNVSLLRH